MSAFTFKVDMSRADQKLLAGRVAAANATSKAGGDAIRAMKAESSRKIRERKAVKATSLTKALCIIYPSNPEVKLWRLAVPSQAMPVVMYPTRQTKRGVSVLVNAGNRVLIPHAFIATMRSGHVGVFRRVGQATRSPIQRTGRRASRYAGTKRQPIKELYTTRVVDVFHDAGFIMDVLTRGEEVFRSTFNRVLPLELAGLLR